MKLDTLVLFAHPDDEILWMGGFLLRFREFLRLDFVCLTFPFNRSRIRGLMRLDTYFSCPKILCLGYQDDPAVYREGAPFHFDDEWVNGIDFGKYDLVFSHNQQGEYGHPHHIYLHNTLKNRNIPFISFGHEEGGDFTVEMDAGQVRQKQAVLKDLYYGETQRCLQTHSYWDTHTERFRAEWPKPEAWTNKSDLHS